MEPSGSGRWLAQRRRRLSFKTVAGLAVVLLIVFGLNTWASLLRFQTFYLGQARERAEVLVTTIVARSETVLAGSGGTSDQLRALVRFPSFEMFLKQLAVRNPGVAAVGVTDASGTFLAHSGSGMVGSSVPEELARRPVDGPPTLERLPNAYGLAQPIRNPADEIIGYAIVMLSDDEIRSVILRTIATAVALFLVALATFSVIAVIVVRRVVSIPLERVTTMIHEITAGAADLSRPIAVRGRDEIADLSVAFNKLLGKIADLVGELEARAQRWTALSSVTRLMTATEQSSEVYNAVARAAATLLGGSLARVWLKAADGATLTPVGVYAMDPALVRNPLSPTVLYASEGIMGVALKSGRGVFLEDVQEDARFARREYAEAAGLHGAAVMPLITGGRALGVLFVYFGAQRRFSDDEKDLIGVLADQAAIAIEQNRLLNDARRAVADLQTKNAELDSFTFAVSHDLKSPVVAIQGLSGLLVDDASPELGERGRDYLGRIQRNCARMEHLITDLLALSRVGRERDAVQVVSVDDVVIEVLSELDDRIRERRVKIVRGELGAIVGLHTQLVQVFANLIGNAVKYLGDAPSPRIEIGREDTPDRAEFWVRDNGIGIEPAYHSQVFEMFQRLRDVEAEGSGVGLSIVKKIVEAAGGRIWVESARGHGATFRFTWPSAPVPRDRREPAGAGLPAAPHA